MPYDYKLLITLILLLFALPARAQDCDCAAAFDQAVQVYENDYALFSIKVTDQNRDHYKAYTEVYRTKAKTASSKEECLPLLQQWLQFFRDGHNSIALAAGSGGKAGMRERIEMDRTAFMADIKKLRKKKAYKGNDLLGIWRYGAYEVGILPNPETSARKRDFVGVVLSSKDKNWKPGDVKFELNHVYGNDYKAVYLRDDDTEKRLQGELKSPYKLEFKGFNTWTKVWPADANTIAAEENTNLYSDFHFRMIDGEIPYIRFPNFYEKRPPFVDSLLKAHHEALLKADFIIVDVRDNNGGDDVVYHPVLPYLLSGPVQVTNFGIWISEGNIEKMLAGRNPEDFDEEGKAEYKYMLSLKNSFFWPNGNKYARTYTPDTIYSPHKKVAVLINGKTVSSGETFVYRVRQSDKVVLYGQNTAGTVDGYNVFTRNIGCFDLHYPSSLRAKDVAENPIDPYGMAPDVYVSPEVDALEFSIQHMRQLLREQKKQPANQSHLKSEK